MVFERHLQVEPHKLGEMPVCVRIFCSEDSTDSEDLKYQTAKKKSANKCSALIIRNLVKVGSNGHLLVKLRRLCKESGAFEIVHLEDVGSSLGGGADDLRSVDFDEAGLCKCVTEEGTHPSFKPENDLVGLNISKDLKISCLKMAWLVGVRRSRTRLSRRVSWFTFAKFPSSSSVTLLPASSICRGSWGSLAETTQTCVFERLPRFN